MDEMQARTEKPTVELEQAVEILGPIEVSARDRIRQRTMPARRSYAARAPQRGAYARRRGRVRQPPSFSAFNKERFVMQLMVSGILIVLVVVMVNIKSSFTADLQSNLKTAVSETTTMESLSAFTNAAKEKASGLFNSVGVIFGYQQEGAADQSVELPTKEYDKDNKANATDPEANAAEAEVNATEAEANAAETETNATEAETNAAQALPEEAAQSEITLYQDAVVDEETLSQINASAADGKND